MWYILTPNTLNRTGSKDPKSAVEQKAKPSWNDSKPYQTEEFINGRNSQRWWSSQGTSRNLVTSRSGPLQELSSSAGYNCRQWQQTTTLQNKDYLQGAPWDRWHGFSLYTKENPVHSPRPKHIETTVSDYTCSHNKEQQLTAQQRPSKRYYRSKFRFANML